MKLSGGAALVAIALLAAGPAWAIPVTVTRVEYDDAKRRLVLDVTGEAEIRTRQIDRRIILEIPDARLRGQTYAPRPTGRRIRAILVSQVAGNPPLVRIEIAPVPGVEPVLSVQQAAGRIYVLLAEPPPPQGERDLETMPAVPLGDLPALANRRIPGGRGRIRGATESASAQAGATRTDPTREAPAPLPVPVAQAAPRPALPGVSPPATRQAEGQETRSGTGRSFAILTFGQAEANENVPATRLVGFPIGPAGLEVQQWLWGFVGLGAELRYFNWKAQGAAPVDRQDGLAVARAGVRAPVPVAEPELHLGVATRFQGFGSVSSWDTPVPLLGGGARIRLADGLGLRLWGQWFPMKVGTTGSYPGDDVWRAGAALLVDVGPLVASAGYTHDDVTVRGGKLLYDAVALGLGLQW